MADQTLSADHPSESVCPWCSTAIVPNSATCASCGAILESEEERGDLPGLTAVDPRALRTEKKPASRNRLLSWISGEYPESDAPRSEASALAPPDPEVQREIDRLALEAEVANLQAEADSLLSEAVVDGRVADLPEEIRPLATAEFDAATLAAATADGDASPVPHDTAAVSTADETPPTDEPAPDDEAAPA